MPNSTNLYASKVENPLEAVYVQKTMNVISKTVKAAENETSTVKVVMMPKRYSFDDNGGGYRGL